MSSIDKDPEPEIEAVKMAISGNLCRCTGYRKIIRAIQVAAEKIRVSIGIELKTKEN